MFSTSLLNTLLLALAVSASPVVVDKAPIKLSLTRHLNLTSIHNLYRHDLNRAKALRAGLSDHNSKRAVISSPADNQAVIYTADVGVGTPATTYSLIIDTGSSNTWVGANLPYHITSSSVDTGDQVSVTYGSGFFSGEEFLDKVTISASLVIPQQSIGAASSSSGFYPYDGILGIGPVDLTLGTLFPHTNTLIPTVTDKLFSQGTISANLISVSFEPTTVPENLNGELTWGGTDSTKFTGAITYVPITTTYPSSLYWGIKQTITYGSTRASVLTLNSGIVDTGTTLVLIATNALTKYRSLTGATFDGQTGLYKLTSAKFALLQSLYFTIGATTFEFTANAQLWPRSLNTYIGGTTNGIYLIIGDIGANSGSGLDFINGYSWLERFYSVYDTGNNRVGIATTPFTFATTN